MGILDRARVTGCARAGLDLVLAVRCAGCHCRDSDQPVVRGLCGRCWSDLDSLDPVFGELGRPLPVVSVGAYDGTLRRVVLNYKERGHTAVRHDLGARLASLVVDCELGGAGRPVLLVPVPSSAASSRARGHQPVTALSVVAASNLRRQGIVAGVLRCLRHARRLADQSELSADARQANLHGAFSVRPRYESLLGATCGTCALLLVDDVVTTGATATEAVRALAAGGGSVSGVITVASTARRFPAAGDRRAVGESPSLVVQPSEGWAV